MKNKSTTSEEDKIRLRFKAKDLDRIDLEEMRRQLEAIQQSETVTEPEPAEEEPVVVVPPDSVEVVEPEPKHEPKESWRWANLPWKGAPEDREVPATLLTGGGLIGSRVSPEQKDRSLKKFEILKKCKKSKFVPFIT